jgi:iron complex outermembrane receptor protein
VKLILEIAAYREEVVVTASSTAQTVDEVSKAVSTVGQLEIDERNEYAVSEALRTVPGLQVQQRGGPGSLTSIKIRGLRNEHSAVLIDGARFRDAAAPQGDASGFLSELTVTDLDRVEVLRGSSSSLYGSNAIGGVINIVSNDGGGHPRGSLLAEGGSLGFVRARGQTSGGVGDDRMTYSLGLSHWSVSEGVDGNDAARNTSFQGRARLRLTPDATVSARIYSANASAMLNESPQAVGELPPTGIIDAEPLSPSALERYESGVPIHELNPDGANFIPSADDPDNEQESRFLSMLLTFEQRPRENFTYSITYHGLATDRSVFEGPEGVTFFEPTADARTDFDGQIHTVNARVDLGLGRTNYVTAGYEFESESFVSRSLPGGEAVESSVDVTERSNTFFIQDQIRLLEGALQLSGAFRTLIFSLQQPEFLPADGSPYQGIDFDSPDSAFTGDGSVAYFMGDTGTKLRAHIGNGYRAPSLFERYGASFGPFGYSAYGDPRLGPERSIAFDAGWDQEMAGNRLRTSATFFYTHLKKMIIFDFSGAIDPATDPFGRLGGYRRVDGGKVRGFELNVTAAPYGGLNLGAAYTYTDAAPPESGFEGLPQAYGIPEHQFSLVATQRFTPNLYVNLDMTFSDSYFAPVFDPVTFASRHYRLDGIAKVDLGVSYTVAVSRRGGLRFFAKVDNLLNQRYFENGFRTPGRLGVAGVAFQF